MSSNLLLIFCKLIPQLSWYVYDIKKYWYCTSVYEQISRNPWLLHQNPSKSRASRMAWSCRDRPAAFFAFPKTATAGLGSQLLTSQIWKWLYLSRILPWLLPVIGYNGPEWWNYLLPNVRCLEEIHLQLGIAVSTFWELRFHSKGRCQCPTSRQCHERWRGPRWWGPTFTNSQPFSHCLWVRAAVNVLHCSIPILNILLYYIENAVPT